MTSRRMRSSPKSHTTSGRMAGPRWCLIAGVVQSIRLSWGPAVRSWPPVMSFDASHRSTDAMSCLLYTSDAADDTPCVDL
eukprot:5315398-Pyramimonas_sp.AAC.1